MIGPGQISSFKLQVRPGLSHPIFGSRVPILTFKLVMATVFDIEKWWHCNDDIMIGGIVTTILVMAISAMPQ
jgi:hypothetical protein